MKKANNKIILIVIVCFIMACVSTDDNKGLHKISQISWFCEINSWKDSMDNPINTTIQIINAVISADGSTIAAMGYDKNSDLYKIHAWNTATGCLINSIDLPEASFHSLGIAPDGKYIVTGIWEQEITVYNLKSCKVIKTIKEPFLRSFILSSDGKLILTGGSGGIIKIYDFKTKNLLQEIDAFKNYTENFTINSNNTIFAAHGDGDNVVVGDIITGDIFLRLSTSELYCLALSSDGKYLVGGESNEPLKIIIWDLESGEQINTLDRGWTNENITSLFISNNNQYIIAVSLNSTLEIWEVATGKLINNLNAHEDGIMTVKMTSDEISFITAGLDMKIKLWQIPTISSHITQLDFPDDFSHVEKYRTMPVDTRVKNVPAEIYNFLHESTVIFFEELVKYLLTDEGDPFMQVKLLHDRCLSD
jgi:WD40 repeat protein